MSSDTNYLADIQADFQGRLTNILPDGWTVIDADTLGENTIRKTTLAVAQGDIVSEIAGAPQPRGFVGIEFTLTLITPEPPGPKALARVSAAAFDLLNALDPMDDLYWSTAERVTIAPNGDTAYRLPVTLLTQFINTRV